MSVKTNHFKRKKQNLPGISLTLTPSANALGTSLALSILIVLPFFQVIITLTHILSKFIEKQFVPEM